MVDRLKDVPKLDRNLSNLQAVADALQEAIQTLRGMRGEPLDKAVTWRDLAEQGLVDLEVLNRGARGRAPGSLVIPGSVVVPPVEDIDLTPPPTPTGLTVTPGITYLIIECDAQLYTQGHGHDRTIVYGAKWANPSVDPEPTFADAVPICEFQGTVFAYATEPATTWCIWIKWKSVDGVLSASPAGGTNGVQATTGQDVRLLLDALTLAAQDPASPYSKIAFRADLFYVGNAAGTFEDIPFYVTTVSITQNGVVAPAGVYIRNALIANGTIANAMIGNLAVDNAKIANMSVAKLTAGSIAVGEYIQSTGFVSGSAGWRIRGDGIAEFSGVVVRGAIYATSGEFGGVTINGALTMDSGGHIKGGQTAYNTGTGFFLGYDGAAYKFSIGSSTQSLTWDGTALMIKGTLAVGTSPAVSGTTMTGSGGVINASGSFALGNSTTNLSFDGTTLTLNGELADKSNLKVGTSARISTASVGARGLAATTVTITAADIPAGETTVPIIVTGSVDTLISTFFDIGVNEAPWLSPGTLRAAQPPTGNVSSYTEVYHAAPGVYEFGCFNHGTGDAPDVANTRGRTITVQILLR